ncbi:MAG: cobalt-precorrin-6A reductase [Hyphomicrobiales bacterium]
MPGERILILGGTAEARMLANRLIDAGHGVVTSLAGVTKVPHLPKGEVRRGGFGGPEGLAAYLRAGGFSTLIDATHPFAAQISRHAAAAAKACGLSFYRLERPAWVAEKGDLWIGAASIAAAVAALPAGARVFLTIGRKEVAPFLARADLQGIMRMIEALDGPPPPQWQLLLARPPFTLAGERELMAKNHVTHVVSKNAGGEEIRAKLLAAREIKIPVVMIERPEKPAAITVSSVDEALRLLSP